MKYLNYVTSDEVTRVCGELGISDWSKASDIGISVTDSTIIMNTIGAGELEIDAEDFCKGLEVELEHGTMFPELNVTNNHPILTGMIVMAHFRESLDYYKRLEVAELEADILKAFENDDQQKMAAKYGKLLRARHSLCESEVMPV